jgi:hypothetical protein
MYLKQICVCLVLAIPLGLVGCSTESTQGAVDGAVSGAAVGAIGGMVSALVFGGDVGEAAARGAVWAGTTGAVAGGVRGAEQADRNEQARQKKKQQELDRLRREIGDDAYRGLEALAECNHAVAAAYAGTAMDSNNRDYALAGYWLNLMTLAEQGDEAQVEQKLPGLVQYDQDVNDVAEGRRQLDNVLVELADIREEYGKQRSCS